jgi:uncharacterized protein (DUF1778 family)
MAKPERKDSRLDLRITQEKRRRYEAAASAEGSTVTSFIEAAADARAAHVLADRRMFALDDEAWDAFVALLDAPPKPNPGLGDLMSLPDDWWADA